MIFKNFSAAAALLALGTVPAMADWSASLISLGANDPGSTGEVECAANGSFGAVWGTGTYTSDSSICTAAVHFGWIQHDQGGTVSFRQVPGLDAYQGSANNGVTTSDYGTWSSSFQITGAVPLAPPAGGGAASAVEITWGQSLDALGVAEAVGEQFTYICPGDRFGGGQLWGTDVYTSDSPVCNAAVHRGLFAAADGGTVTVLVLGSQPVFVGSERNGVTSADYPEWPRSYVFQ